MEISLGTVSSKTIIVAAMATIPSLKALSLSLFKKSPLIVILLKIK